MRDLFHRFDGDRERVVEAYADAERRGEVPRTSDVRGMDAREYASRLFSDGVRKGWLRPAEPRELAGFDDMVATLRHAGLPPPPVPHALRTSVQRIQTWCWATRDIDPMSMYLFGEYQVEFMAGD